MSQQYHRQKELIFYVAIYLWSIGGIIAGVLNYFFEKENYLDIYIAFYTIAISVVIMLHYKKQKDINSSATILLWAMSLSLFTLVFFNHYNTDIVLSIFMPLLGSIFLKRETLMIHGILFSMLLLGVILYGYIVHPEYVLFQDPALFNSFLVLLFFAYAFSIVYHIYIQSAYHQLEKSNREKEILLQEVHHRVKNNLNMMSSILALQSQRDNEMTYNLISSNRERIESIAMVHEMLYESKNFIDIDFKGYVKKLYQHLTFACSGIHISLEIVSKNIILSLETMSSIGLIMQELISNSLKYAICEGGTIYITLIKEEGYYILTYADSGRLTQKMDKQSTQLGIRLIKLKTAQLKGEMLLDKDNGYKYRIKFYDEV